MGYERLLFIGRSVLIFVSGILVAAFVFAGEPPDPDRTLKTMMRLHVVPLNEMDSLLVLPRERNVDTKHACILPSTWLFVAEDESVVILFTDEDTLFGVQVYPKRVDEYVKKKK